MDVRDLKFEQNTFDLIIDKSTIDALLCGDSSFINVALMLKEVQRVLKDDGIYMIISYGKPENRLLHLERKHLSFDVSIFTIKKDFTDEEDDQEINKVHYVYICKKNKNWNEAAELFDDVYTELLQQELMDKELEYAELNEEEEEGDEYNDNDHDNIYSDNLQYDNEIDFVNSKDVGNGFNNTNTSNHNYNCSQVNKGNKEVKAKSSEIEHKTSNVQLPKIGK